MSSRLTTIFILAIILAGISAGLYFYPQFPERVASHWNSRGEVDGYMGKFWGVFIMPIISVFLLIVFLVFPRLDPKRENIKKFRNYFNVFIFIIFLFLLYVHFLTLAWNLGQRFDMGQFMIPALAILFYYAGILISHCEPNWTIGIRTPWTLSSDRVWQKTHDLGGKFFRIASGVMLVGILFPLWGVWFVIAPLLVAVIFLFVFSYLEYKKEGRK